MSSLASKYFLNEIKIMLARKKEEVAVGLVINKICHRLTSLLYCFVLFFNECTRAGNFLYYGCEKSSSQGLQFLLQDL